MDSGALLSIVFMLQWGLVSSCYRNWCYGEHGCFTSTGEYYHILKRPTMYVPYFDTERIKYALYTRKNRYNAQFLKRNDNIKVISSHYNDRKQTKVLIHGWTQFSRSWSRFETKAPGWLWDMKDALLKRGDFNVIIMDWTVGSDYHYMKAAPNTQLAGADLTLLVKYFQSNTNTRASDFHIIGHSLGAQVAADAGKFLHLAKHTLGRITGLDPAEEYYGGMPIVVRLDPSDARFVDVIHTNGGYAVVDGLGVPDPVGHVDFYPNGGWDQPGCGTNGCSHGRAHALFISSIRRQCHFRATQCRKYSYFKAGWCAGSRHAAMGFDADNIKRRPGEKFIIMFLHTKGREPYC